MSRGKFRLMGGVFTDPSGKPIRVNVTANASGWSSYNTAVLNKMKIINPTFNFGLYDNRTNFPTYKCDNSVSVPDMKPDYVVIIWRYNSGWDIKIQPGLENIVYTPIDYSSVNIGGYNFDAAGYVLAGGDGGGIGSFVHELGHQLFSGPHYLGANNAMGDRMYIHQSGWGMVTTSAQNEGCNAFERWLLGWSDNKASGIDANILQPSDLQNNGIYTLKDFLTTGDAIRIRIPKTNQHVWIENHQKKSIWDVKQNVGDDLSLGNETVADFEAGLYMMVEDMLPSFSSITTGFLTSSTKVNSVKLINAQGQYDYSRDPVPPLPIWDDMSCNIVYTFGRQKANPLSGTHPGMQYVDDFITYNINRSNCTATSIPKDGVIKSTFDHNGGANRKEAFFMMKETNGTATNMLYGGYGGRNTEAINNFNRRSDAFQVGDKINMGTNPTITNYPLFSRINNRLDTTFLNSLSIEVLSKSGDDVTIQVKLNNYAVNDNPRWTGNIGLRNISNDVNPDLNLAVGKNILIDQSGYTNRLTKHPITNKFVNPTVFTLSESAFVNMNTNSTITVDSGSTIVMKNTSKIVVASGAILKFINNSKLLMSNDAEIIVMNGGKLLIESGTKVTLTGNAKITLQTPTGSSNLLSSLEVNTNSLFEVNDNSQLILENKSKLILKNSTSLVLANQNSTLVYENGALINLVDNESTISTSGKIIVGDNATFHFTGNGFIKIASNSNSFIPGINSSVRFTGVGQFDKVIELESNTTMTISKNFKQMISIRGKYLLGENSRINIYCPGRFTLSKITSTNETSRNNHKGLNLGGQTGFNISSSVFEHGSNGLNISYDPSIAKRGGKLYISSSTFHNNQYGYRQYTGGYDLNSCTFTNNSIAVESKSSDINSLITRCTFTNNSEASVKFVAAGSSNLTISESNISNSSTGVYIVGNTQLNIKCSSLDVGVSGISSLFDANLNLSTQLGNFGNNDFTRFDEIIHTTSSGDIFLNEGYNLLSPTNGRVKAIINGTMNRFQRSLLTPFQAVRNNWNNTNVPPIFGVDYYLTSSVPNYIGDSLYFEDLNPTSDQFSCVTLQPCTNCIPETLNPLKDCKNCDTVSTTHISYKPLNVALDVVITNLTDPLLTLESRVTEVEVLKEILTYNFRNVSENERFLLKLAYRTFKDELAKQVSDTLISSNAALDTNSFVQTYFSWMDEIQTYQQELMDSNQLFFDPSILKLDHALIYRIKGDLSTAQSIVNDLQMEVIAEKLPYINYWDCILDKEAFRASNNYANEEFDYEVDKCLMTFLANYNTSGGRIALAPATVKPKSTTNPTKIKKTEKNQLLNIYPNPSNGIFTIVIPETAKVAKIVVTDLYGRKVKEQIFQNTNQAELNMSDLNDGYYNCTVTTENSKYEKKISKID